MNWRALLKVIAFAAVAGLMAAMEIGTLTGPHVGATHEYHAMFGGTDGVSGLRAGNTVKVAGVPVGKVDSVDLLDANHAKVTFSMNGNQQLTDHSFAIVRYANLIGQRYLAITQPPGESRGSAVPYGYTIPMQRTQPALSLTALFNGFRPLFAALTPDQVNELAQDVIDILQGQSARIGDLIAKTASFTSNLAARDDTFSQVLDSLTTLLTTVSKHDNQLATMLTSLRALTSELHAEGPAILDSLDSVDGLMGSVNSLLSRLEDHGLPADIADLDHITGVLASNLPTVDKLVNGFVLAFSDFTRVTQNGSFANAYICTIEATTVGSVTVTGNQIVKGLLNALGLSQLQSLLKSLGLLDLLLDQQIKIPLKLPNGTASTATAHTKVCR